MASDLTAHARPSHARKTFTVSRGWAIVGAAFAATGFAVGGSQYAFGIFVNPLETEFGWTRTQLNLSLSIGMISGLISPLVGWAIDRYGARFIMPVSLLIVAGAFLLRAGMSELWHWYALSALMAVGMPGAAFLPAGKLIGTWFPVKRGRVMGIAIAGNNVFGVIAVPLLALFIGAHGWRPAFLTIGGGVALVAVAAWFIVRDRSDTGEAIPKPARGPRIMARANPAAPGLSLREAMRTPSFWLLTVGFTAAGFTYPAVMTQLVPHYTAQGWAQATAALALTLLAGVGLISKISWGWISERLTARYSTVIAMIIISLGVVSIILAGGSSLAWPAIVLFGLGFGGMGALTPLTVLEIFGVRHFGSIQGVVTTVASVIPVLIGPYLAGRLYDSTGSYDAAFAITSVIFVVGALCVLAARAPRKTVAAVAQPG